MVSKLDKCVKRRKVFPIPPEIEKRLGNFGGTAYVIFCFAEMFEQPFDKFRQIYHNKDDLRNEMISNTCNKELRCAKFSIKLYSCGRLISR